MKAKYVVIIQCDLVHNRCSGFACTNAFYNKEEKFADYDDTIRYISFSCGGCCGKGIAAKLEHFAKKCKTKANIEKDEIIIHLSSCMVTDNHHSDRCPHIDYIKGIIAKKGYPHVIEGSYISERAKKKREAGIYTCY